MNRYVIARHCHGGIGDHLSCLIGSWWLAKRTHRILVIDWRGSRFNPDISKKRNCFHDFFAPSSTLGGVTTIADDGVGDIEFPRPSWPAKWTTDALARSEHVKHTSDEVAAVNHLVTSRLDRAEPTIAINQWVEPPPPRAAVTDLVRDLRLAQWAERDAEAIWQNKFGSRPVIAIHLRHGNGENIGHRAAYWPGPVALVRQLALNNRSDIHAENTTGRFNDNMPVSLVGLSSLTTAEHRFCRSVADQFARFSGSLGTHDAIPLLLCDSVRVVGLMKLALPGMIALPKYLPGLGDGPLHQTMGGSVSDQITREMFVELELMKRCTGLLYMDSGFSILTRAILDEQHVRRLMPSQINRAILKVASLFMAAMGLVLPTAVGLGGLCPDYMVGVL